MAKFIATSGSYFTPFTYDELAKPIMQMQEAHNAAQDAYDKLNLETNALGRYITDNPDDQQAKQLYDSYLTKLNTLQENLWNSGYNAQTRRDLSAATAGYAKDIGRLTKAIQTRQERSKEFWEAKHKNPDLITGADPGASGLDNYLNSDTYGQDYYTYSGNDFMKEVAADANARASEMLKDPRIEKDPRLKGYLLRIEQEGFTSAEVGAAANAVKAYVAGDQTALSSLDDASGILANVLLNHLNSTGAKGRVSDDEYNRLVDYGVFGLSHAIGKKKVDTVKDLEWAEAMDRANYAWKTQYKAKADAAAASSAHIGKIEDRYTRTVTGPHANRAEKRTAEYSTDKQTLLIAPNGREVHNNVEASSLVYGEDIRRAAYEKLGFDIGRKARGLTEDRFLQGAISHNGKVYNTRYNPHTNAVEFSETGDKGTWQQSKRLTEIYNESRTAYENNLAKYKGTDIGKLATIDPDKQYSDSEKYGLSSRGYIPLSEFRQEVMRNPMNSTQTVEDVYIAREGTDSGEYVGKIADYIANSFNFNADGTKVKDTPPRRRFKGTTDYIHEMTDYGAVKRKAVKDPNDVFTFKDGKITNISEVRVTPDSILDALDNGRFGRGYIICKTKDGSEYAVSVDMMRSGLVNNVFAKGRQSLLKLLEYKPYISNEEFKSAEDDILDWVSYTLKDTFGYGLNTVSEGGTSSKNLN